MCACVCDSAIWLNMRCAPVLIFGLSSINFFEMENVSAGSALQSHENFFGFRAPQNAKNSLRSRVEYACCVAVKRWLTYSPPSKASTKMYTEFSHQLWACVSNSYLFAGRSVWRHTNLRASQIARPSRHMTSSRLFLCEMNALMTLSVLVGQ